MERELFRRLYEVAYRLGRTRRVKHVVHPDWKVVMVFMWGVLHDRPRSWSCDARNWPDAARGLELPSESTLSRRLRRDSVRELFDAIEASLRDALGCDAERYIDAKPLPIGGHSRDPDARVGRGAGMIDKGYKLHAISDERHVPSAWTVRPMNENESRVAHALLDKLDGTGLLVGDNAYDANTLYDKAESIGWQLLGARRPGTSLGHIRHSPSRIAAHIEMPESLRAELLRHRVRIEHFFGNISSVGFGLGPLPNWVRRLHRVTAWVHAKILCYMAYLLNKRAQAT